MARFTFLLFISITLTAVVSRAQDKIVRKELLTADIGIRVIRKVDVREINLEPGQKTGYHKHPCPVISYIVSGSVYFQIEGDTLRLAKAGEIVFEPANTNILRFENASTTEPLKFIPYYLLNDETRLIEMLPEKQKDKK